MSPTGPCLICNRPASFTATEAGEVVARLCSRDIGRKRPHWRIQPIEEDDTTAAAAVVAQLTAGQIEMAARLRLLGGGEP